MKLHFEKYRQLGVKIDAICTQLHEVHSEHTQCKKGCSSCCMNFCLLPVEFHFILEHLKDELVELNRSAENDQCVFLVNNACSIYQYRPIICRSHGLPILFMDDEGENWNLSFCPLNFDDLPDEYFSLENSYDQDTLNSELFLINKAFIEAYQDKNYGEMQMLEMSSLVDYL